MGETGEEAERQRGMKRMERRCAVPRCATPPPCWSHYVCLFSRKSRKIAVPLLVVFPREECLNQQKSRFFFQRPVFTIDIGLYDIYVLVLRGRRFVYGREFVDIRR